MLEEWNKIFLFGLTLSVISVITASWYRFSVVKTYDFITEAACNPQKQSCFHRDCNTDDCPPNDLDDYRIFHIQAFDFKKCINNSCLTECTLGTITCIGTTCDKEKGDTCSE